MIASRSLKRVLFENCLKAVNTVQKAQIYNRDRIGNRDWVGFGYSGSANYMDSVMWPFPAIRFKENTNELLALREKEKGDWRKLSIEEKKTLYRASFRQTLAEVSAPTGEWKSSVGGALILISVGLWLWIISHLFLYPPLPESFSEQWRRDAFRRMIDLKEGHLTGLASKWDYEKDDWKSSAETTIKEGNKQYD